MLQSERGRIRRVGSWPMISPHHFSFQSCERRCGGSAARIPRSAMAEKEVGVHELVERIVSGFPCGMATRLCGCTENRLGSLRMRATFRQDADRPSPYADRGFPWDCLKAVRESESDRLLRALLSSRSGCGPQERRPLTNSVDSHFCGD